ncbi:MAG: hypothetical protein E6767_02645 [Dysgonomonas sp.]|nr:hypothetical protein [Dysgonomonas sp.]
MKNKLLLVVLLCLLGNTSLSYAQNTDKMPFKLAEISKMVTLNSSQKEKLQKYHDRYVIIMDSAIYNISDKREAALLIRKTKKNFDNYFFDLLSEQQKTEYIRSTSTPEVMEKAQVKVDILEKSGKYTKKELQDAYDKIFEYMMLEKIVYSTQKFDIEKQKENIAQLKRLEPQYLKTANSFQKVKHQGKKYQDGFQW